MKVQLDKGRRHIDVNVERISENEETVESTYKVVGTIDGVAVDGDVTLFEGGDFEHELGCDDECVVAIFEYLDEQAFDAVWQT